MRERVLRGLGVWGAAVVTAVVAVVAVGGTAPVVAVGGGPEADLAYHGSA